MERSTLRDIPSVDEILKTETSKRLLELHPRMIVKGVIRNILDEKRKSMLDNPHTEIDLSINTLLSEIKERIQEEDRGNLRTVINATGIIIHTNLGRAILSDSAIKNVLAIAGSYSNLEYELNTGKRGKRYIHLDGILREITGAEASIVVNNNAAAVLLVLNTLAKDREVIVSRGELIEIGGSFRIPEVMERSGAILKEIGTTNKTHLKDYESAITEKTALLLKVHPSNYRILGFTEEVVLEEIVNIGRRYSIPVMNDLGSGCLVDLKRYGISGEPTVKEVLKTGVDIVTFSGDKLLGGPQAGIILGKEGYISRIQANPLTRAVRIDKLTLAAMEATLREYLDMEKVAKTNPTLRMLLQPLETIRKRARKIKRLLNSIPDSSIFIEITDEYSQAGGGSLPLINLSTSVVSIRPQTGSMLTVESLEERLRKGVIPVIARIKDGRLLLDARTIRDNEIHILAEMVKDAIHTYS